MSVTDGQRASASVLNGAFLSKSSSNSATGILTLANTDAASGSTISNVQKAINEVTFKTYATQSIASSGTINVEDYKGLQYRRVTGSGSAITLSSTPFGPSTHNIPDGTVFRIMGTSNTNTVTIQHNDANYGAVLNGNCTLGLYDSITLQWDNTLTRYIEVGRSF